MKSMMISDAEKKENAEHSTTRDVPKYPYGLKIHFDENSFQKLGLEQTPQVGDKVMILAYAEIVDVHMSSNEGDEKKVSMGVQLMDVEIKKKEAEKDIAKELYGSREG